MLLFATQHIPLICFVLLGWLSPDQPTLLPDLKTMNIFDEMVKSMLAEVAKATRDMEQALKQNQPIRNTAKPTVQKRPPLINGVWTVELLLELEWKRFEEICKAYLIMIDQNAELTDIGADGGIDIKIKNQQGNIIAIVQCKAWLSNITVKEVREFFGVMASEKVAQGYYFTTSTFTDDAAIFCADKNITLVDKYDLIKNIKDLTKKRQETLYKMATKGDYTTPTCPNCDKKMLKRVGKNGEFWGCANYPKCKNTLHVRKVA